MTFAIVDAAAEHYLRSGQYRKQTLINRYGADMRLPDLREEIAQCSRQGKMHDACMVHYIDLIPRLACLAPLSYLPDSWTMTYAKKLDLIAAGAIIVLSAGTAAAQLPMPSIDLMQERPLDPEEQAKRKAVDDAYKSTMEKLPDQKKSNDPWGNFRSTTKTSPKQR